MQFDKDLCFFDLETTGSDIIKDRIVQIALVKYSKEEGTPIEKSFLVNPQIPISPEAIAVHGITEEMVKDAPPFKLIAVELSRFIGDADLAGYNSNRFDIPLLTEEFGRVGIEFDTTSRRLIDVLQIFYKMEPRTLKAALRFYCGKELTNAHDALADTRATADVFFGQLERYKDTDYFDERNKTTIEKPIAGDLQRIHDFLEDKSQVDFTARFVRNAQGEIVFNFGQHKGEVAKNHPHFLNWITQRDFPTQVKNIAKAILKGKLV